MHAENVKIFRRTFPSPFEESLNLFQEDALLHPRTCPSRSKKTPFLEQEGRLLFRYSQHTDYLWVTDSIIRDSTLLFRRYLSRSTV